MELKMISSLAKVFHDEIPTDAEVGLIEGFVNETLSFQLAFTDNYTYFAKIAADFPLRIRAVHQIPAYIPLPDDHDDYILRKPPGLFPDRLTDVKDGIFHVCAGQWRSLWIDIENADPGLYTVNFQIFNMNDGKEIATKDIKVEIYPVALPPQMLKQTKWFSAGCLAEYYNVEPFSERHWGICESFIQTAVKRGINMILTPSFTPPLDTAVGAERITTQLIDVKIENGNYSFCFNALQRWIEMCFRCGAEYIEFAHLFTQWGAKAAPKIMATINGEYKQIFGWETDALGDGYKKFLSAYLTSLVKLINKLKIKDKCYFHISDEPGVFGESPEQYKAAIEFVEPYLKDFKIIDALSDIDYFKTGIIRFPVPDTHKVEEFLKVGMVEPWTYYCGFHYKKVSNLLVYMPSARNRIFGVQLYKFRIEGFLHWGYNWYSTWHNYMNINPYASIDQFGTWGGDAFQVYPGSDGNPEESIRHMVFAQALYDMRALQMLESLTNRDFVLDLIGEPMTFEDYPHGDEYILDLRSRVNYEIIRRVHE